MHSVPENVGFLGMKGLIDLRVADILAKQAAMQHRASLFQAHISQHEADRAALYTAKADKMEEAYNAQVYDPRNESMNTPPDFQIPHASMRYSPWGISHLQKGRTDPTLTGLDSTTMASFSTPTELLVPLSLWERRRLLQFI
jgi:hypothetical protein